MFEGLVRCPQKQFIIQQGDNMDNAFKIADYGCDLAQTEKPTGWFYWRNFSKRGSAYFAIAVYKRPFFLRRWALKLIGFDYKKHEDII